MKWPMKRKLQAFVALLSSFALMLCAVSARADEEKDRLEGATSTLQNQLSAINQDMLAISNEISTTEMQIEITNGEILRTEESIMQARLAEEEQYEKMSVRIKYIYETGNVSMLEMLFSSKNLADFLNAADFIQIFNSCDQEMLEELRQAREALVMQQETLTSQKESLQELQDSLSQKYNELFDKARATSTDLFTYNMQLEQIRAQEAAAIINASNQTGTYSPGGNGDNDGNSGNSGDSDGNSGGNGDNGGNSDNGGGNSGNSGNPGNSGGNSGNSGGQSPATSSDLDLFAAILECEAYQNYDCLLAVATVIMNRVSSPLFDNTIRGVIYAPNQFEPVWTGRLNAVLSRGPSALSYQVARDALNGARHSDVADCYFFLYAGATNRQGVNIGNNIFFQSW